MDIRDLKKNSDLSYDVAVAKRNALEKARSRQVLVHHGHLFRADPETINLVKALIDQSVDNVVLLDTNDNPVSIKDPEDFLQRLVQRNQETLNSYLETYETFTSKGK
jgi:ribosomal 50S subunit-associated protein YjgA (DUF615 family)